MAMKSRLELSAIKGSGKRCYTAGRTAMSVLDAVDGSATGT